MKLGGQARRQNNLAFMPRARQLVRTRSKEGDVGVSLDKTAAGMKTMDVGVSLNKTAVGIKTMDVGV